MSNRGKNKEFKEAQFKKGKSGNPSGKAKIPLPPELRQKYDHMRKIDAREFQLTAHKILRQDMEVIHQAAQDESLPAMDAIIARLISHGYKKTDINALAFVFDRVLGKPKESYKIEIDEKPAPKMTSNVDQIKQALLANLPTEQLEQFIGKKAPEIVDAEFKEVKDE